MAARDGDRGAADADRARAVRLWRLRRNPLRRRSDVLEGWLRLAAGLLLVLVIPAGCLLTAASVVQGTLRAGEDLRRASAVLVERAPGEPEQSGAGWFAAIEREAAVPVAARWTAPDGTLRTGIARAPTGSEPGTRVTVWLDEAGERHARPPGAGQAWGGGVLAALAVGMPAALLVMGVRGALCARLDARRTESWAREWAEVGPAWSGRQYGR